MAGRSNDLLDLCMGCWIDCTVLVYSSRKCTARYNRARIQGSYPLRRIGSPRVCDLARLARDELQFLATAMRFRYFGTKELRSIPIFTWQGGISGVDCLRVCLVLAMQAYVDQTSSRVYIHSNPVWPYRHVFMSQVPNRATRLHFLVGSQTCSQWLCTIMDRIVLVSIRSVGAALFVWWQPLQLSTVVYRSMSCSAPADGPVGKSSASSTTELVFVRWPRASA